MLVVMWGLTHMVIMCLREGNLFSVSSSVMMCKRSCGIWSTLWSDGSGWVTSFGTRHTLVSRHLSGLRVLLSLMGWTVVVTTTTHWDAMTPLTNEIAHVLVTTMGIWNRFMTFFQWGKCVDNVALARCVGCEHSVVLAYCVECEHVSSH